MAGAASPSVPSCPVCLAAMVEQSRTEMTISFCCASCDARWQEQREMATASAPVPGATQTAVVPVETPRTAGDLQRSILYGLSMPERVVRSAIGLTAGAARELAELVVPPAFKDSTSYRIAIDNSLGFLVETIGGVPKAGRPEGDSVDDGAAEAGEHIARKAVGNFVDLAGLATLHVSPMWLLAVVSDVAYGTRSYTLELARELEAQGVIDSSSTVHNVDDLLDAVQRTCNSAANAFDKPPLSIDELRATIRETRESAAQTDLRKILPEAEVRRYWEEMRAAAQQADVSMLGVSANIAMQTLDRVKTVGQGTLLGLKVAGGLLNRTVIGHYRDSLVRLREKGFFPTLAESCGPYVTAVWNNFSTEKKSWTETLLDPRRLARLWGRAGSRLSDENSSAQQD